MRAWLTTPLNGGNNHADVHGDDADRLAFLDALDKTRERYPFRLLKTS